MSFGYSRTVLRRAPQSEQTAVPSATAKFHAEQAYRALLRARLHVMLAERASPYCTENAIHHVLLGMDTLKPGAIARLMALAEDER